MRRISVFALLLSATSCVALTPTPTRSPTPSPTPTFGDFGIADINADGIVNHNDLNILGESYWYDNTSSRIDLDGDGSLNWPDFLLFGSEWFRITGVKNPSLESPDHGADKLLAGTLGVDLIPGNPQFTPTFPYEVVDLDSDIDTNRTVTVGEEFTALVRLNGALNLLGVSFDLHFSPLLEIVDFRETRMDLDYDGLQSFPEMDAILTFFSEIPIVGGPMPEWFDYTFNDGAGLITTSPGYLLDFDRDGDLSFPEIIAYISEYLGNIDGTDTPFWTEVASRRVDHNESVELFDSLADMNVTSAATDNFVLLLRRPETPAEDFGFDGDAILFEVTFRAVEAGIAEVAVTNALGVDENFVDINTDVQSITNIVTPSIVTIIE